MKIDMPGFGTERIKLQQIGAIPDEVRCPCCQEVIYQVNSDGFQVIHEYTPREEDTILGLYRSLSATQRRPNGFDVEVQVGAQSCCHQEYYMVGAHFVNADFVNVDVDEEQPDLIHFFKHYLDYNEIGGENFIASYEGDHPLIPQQWVMTQVPSPKGMIHSHWFGPFSMKEGWYMDHGRELLLRLWGDLRLLVQKPVHSTDGAELKPFQEQLSPQWLHWDMKFVQQDPVAGPSLEAVNASVSLIRQERDKCILHALKYFSNPQEAKAFARAIGSFLEDALFELDLDLICKTPEADLVWPSGLREA